MENRWSRAFPHELSANTPFCMRVLLFAFVIFSVLPAGALTPAQRDMALDDLRQGEADKAIQLLGTSIQVDPNDAEAHQLLCRVYFQEERWDGAIEQCQKSIALEPANSNTHLWLGRALGEKADRALFVSAFGLGRKVHSEFETAVQLGPTSIPALFGLGEFYADAPPIVGGGAAKANGIVDRLERLDAASAEELRGRIAVKQKDQPGAEAHFKAAITQSANPAPNWMVLASFYLQAQLWDKMQQAITSGLAADPTHGAPTVEAANLLMRSKRDPQTPIRLFESYLASPNKSETAPAFRVEADLAALLAAQGDTAGAKQHLAAAAELASGYHPAEANRTRTGR
jgi:tetratricopeptide (TPR) repeat protein